MVVTGGAVLAVAAARADLRPRKGWDRVFDKIDWARPSVVSGSGESSPSSGAFEG